MLKKTNFIITILMLISISFLFGASKDLKNNIKNEIALYTAALSTTTAPGVIIDTNGFESVTFSLFVGALPTGTVTALVQDGDVSTLSDAANVADSFLIGTEGVLTATNTITTVGYVGKKRYVRLSAVCSSTETLTVGGVAIKGHPIHAKTS